MADKDVKRRIAELKKKIGEQQRDRNNWAGEIPQVTKLIEDGGGAEFEQMYTEITNAVAGLDKTLAQLQTELDELNTLLPQGPKFDPEKHPLLKKASEKTEPAKPVTFNAGDMCEAQWSDRQWYKAKVQTVLGSSADPKYHVRFIDYNETMTVGRDAVRPPANEKKRKAEAPPELPAPTPVVNSPHVISGPASLNPDAMAAKKEPASDAGAPQRRKIGSGKALERKMSNWKNFTAKGPGKKFAQKESMFRSGTGVNSRVGFTGSGAGMTETQKRVRHNNKGDEDAEDGDPSSNSRESRKDDWHSRGRY